jgi:hypothetical protein
MLRGTTPFPGETPVRLRTPAPCLSGAVPAWCKSSTRNVSAILVVTLLWLFAFPSANAARTTLVRDASCVLQVQTLHTKSQDDVYVFALLVADLLPPGGSRHASSKRIDLVRFEGGRPTAECQGTTRSASRFSAPLARAITGHCLFIDKDSASGHSCRGRHAADASERVCVRPSIGTGRKRTDYKHSAVPARRSAKRATTRIIRISSLDIIGSRGQTLLRR